MKQIGIIGGGSFGTALAQTLAQKGHQVSLWDIDEVHRNALEKDRENKKYLRGITLHKGISVCQTVEETVNQAFVVLFAIPSQHFRSGVELVKPYIGEETILVNVAKGIEQKTLKRMSEIAKDHLPNHKYVALSGPSHAEEVGLGLPTTVAVASDKREVAEQIQELFITDRFRVYTSDDLVGVELGGALKNIIALGSGISDGIGFGDNAKAALMTRGMAEITRLGAKLGADPVTFAGLTGVGDLIVTCTSMHSRNRRCGMLIGEGKVPEEATKEVGMVVEGMFTTEAAYELAKKYGVEMPITNAIYQVINGKTTAREAVEQLMGRERKHEQG